MNAPIPTAATSTLASMKAARRWLLRASDKKPVYADGTPRRGELDGPEDVARLVTYAEAQEALQRLQPTRPDLAGLGFSLGPDGAGCWQGIDLDHISLRPDLAELAETLPGYVETSIGGDGLHSIGYGPSFANTAHAGVEAYCGKRYFSFSGEVVRDEPPADLRPFISMYAELFHPPKGSESQLKSPQDGFIVPLAPDVLADLKSALEHLSPLASDYATWIACGQALADPQLCGEGKQLWFDWSAVDPRFNPEQAERKWLGFRPTSTGYAAIFSRAQAAGWTNPRAVGVMQPASSNEPAARFKLVSLAGLTDAPPPAPEFWIEDLLPAKVVTLLGAHGGTGKTMLGLIAAVSMATGRPFMGKVTKRAKVLVVSGEDDGGIVRWRLAKICEQYAIGESELDGWLTVLDATEDDPTLYAEMLANGTRAGVPTNGYAELKVIGAKYDVLIIDNASDVYAADENARSQVRGFIRSLAKLVREQAGAVLLLVHIDKTTARSGGSEGYSGSTAWHNSARSRLFLKADEHNALILEHQKSNFGKRAEPIGLCWSDSGVLTLAEGGGRWASGTDDRDAVLSLLAEYQDRGEVVSYSTHSPYNAWKLLHQQPSFPKRLKKDQLGGILRDAERAGLLVREQGRNSSRHKTESWKVSAAGRAAIDLSRLF
ncbi:MAG: AAA family ATPase [Zoogloea sp.]|uniref:AAA family ATPase n=1 Tax=Zoogloea sp. TaxID=49181 RepID=UPI0026130749|nr:AAA family ATPase [Zoogloea sp.]MDD2987389.1 AAA family ATPase [Zoogloea sp.]